MRDVFIQFSQISPAGGQTMEAQNEEAGDDEQKADASKPELLYREE